MDAFTPTPPPEYELQKLKNLADRDEKLEGLGLLKKVEACKRPPIPRRKRIIKKIDPTNLRMSERLKVQRQNLAKKSGVQLAKLEEKAAILQEKGRLALKPATAGKLQVRVKQQPMSRAARLDGKFFYFLFCFFSNLV